MKTTFTFNFLLFAISLFAQSNIQQATSINGDGSAAAASAMLDVSATDKGMLVPRLTTVQRTAIASPAMGLLVFDTSTGSFWFFNGTVWVDLSAPKVLADADGDTKVQAEETPDEDVIRFDLAGTERLALKRNSAGITQLSMPNSGNNIFVGENAGNGSTSAFSNIAIGKDALFSNSDRSNLVAVGDSALYNNGVGATVYWLATGNTAIGSKALLSNTIGYHNTAVGDSALYSNIGGYFNTANGRSALSSNTTGESNTANGWSALLSNISGFHNTANGRSALMHNTTGVYNTATGTDALGDNTTGSSNIASGSFALSINTSGDGNTAIGFGALGDNTTGDFNTALGYLADINFFGNITNSTAIGARAQALSSNSLVLGSINGVNGATSSVNVGIGTTAPEVRLQIEGGTDAATSGGGFLQIGESSAVHLAFDNNEIMARNNGAVTALNLNIDGGNVRLGNSSSNVGIGRSATTNNLEVEGTASKTTAGSWLANSDARLKKNIRPLNSEEMLQKMLALQGIAYEWNDDKTGYHRPEGIQFGFTAQNVREVFPSLVSEDNVGFLQTAYGTYDAMVVEAIRALTQKNEELSMENAAMKTQLAALAVQLDKISMALQAADIAIEK